MSNRIPKFNHLNEAAPDFNNVNTLVMKMKEAEVLTHFFHLSTGNYEQHIALNGFYTGMNELFDEFVEQYQGQFGITQFDGSFNLIYQEPEIYINSFADYLSQIIEDFEDNASLSDVLTKVLQLATKTAYLLKLK